MPRRPPPPGHGTTYRYAVLGCRCKWCTAANRHACASYRKRALRIVDLETIDLVPRRCLRCGGQGACRIDCGRQAAATLTQARWEWLGMCVT